MGGRTSVRPSTTHAPRKASFSSLVSSSLRSAAALCTLTSASVLSPSARLSASESTVEVARARERRYDWCEAERVRRARRRASCGGEAPVHQSDREARR